jgi:hypothetical protein
MTTNARRLTRLCWALLALAGVGGCSGGTSKPDAGRKENTSDPKKAAELKWARDVAETFLHDVVGGKWAEAATSTTAAYMRRDRSGTGSHSIMTTADGISDGYKPGTALGPATISAEEIAPEADEASFKGKFNEPGRTGTFTLRVVKEKESGKWRVDHFSANLSPVRQR